MRAPAATGWTCTHCGAPIGGSFGDGCVEISYWPAPVDATLPAPAVQFEAHHATCDQPAAAAPVSYLISCARVTTPAAWAACVAQTAEHAWMTKADVVAMLAFWFEARGTPLPAGDDAPEPAMRRTP